MLLRAFRMREVEVGSGKILVARDNGQYFAIGNKCSHYAAPLIKGEGPARIKTNI